VNAPTQGGAADLMKIAMVRADRKLRSVGLHEKVHLQMNIHDALVWEAHRSVSPQRIIDLVNPEVCIPVPGWPVIKADWEVGTRWGSMVKLNLDANNKIIVPKRAPAKEPELAMAG
jgi:DNA polymerase-1